MKNANDANQNGAQPEMFEFNLLQLLNYLYSHRWWIIIGTAICVTAATAWVALVKQHIYRTNVTINIDLFAEEKGGASQFASPFFMQDQMVGNKIGLVEQYFDSEEFQAHLYDLIMSEEPPKAQAENIALIRDELERKNIEGQNEVAGYVHSRIDLKGYADKSRIDLFGSASKPVLAAAYANVCAHALIEYNRTILLQRLRNLKNFMSKQTQNTKAQLLTLENEFVNLQKRAKIISPDEIRNKVNALQIEQEAKLIEFDRHYAAINALITETEGDLEYFKKMMQESKPASALYIEQIQRRLDILRFQKLQTGQTASDSPGGSFEDANIDKGIANILADLTKQLQRLGPVSASPWEYVKKIETALFDLKQRRQHAKSEMLAQQAAVQRTNKQFIGLPDVLKQMAEIKRTIDLTTTLYTMLMSRYQDTQIKEAAHTNDLIMVSSAQPPGAPSGLGKTKTVLLSIIGGVVLSCLPLFLRFVLLPTIRNVKDLRHLNVPIIGAVGWHRPPSAFSMPLALHERSPRLLESSPNSAEANALRFVRFQVEQALQIRAYQAGKASKLLQIGSVNPNEGRSFVAANLSDLFATSGVRTCLIDLDFGNPGAGEFFPDAKVEKSPLVDMFPQACKFEMLRVSDKLTVIRPSEASINNMSEVLETREFESALNALEVIFELIILDTPPLTGHMEPVVTAQYSDAFLLVINQRRTLRNEVEEAIRNLQGSLKLPIYGVMNFIFDEMSTARRKYKKIDRRQRRKKKNSTPPPDLKAA